jgi:hypothetical protein
MSGQYSQAFAENITYIQYVNSDVDGEQLIQMVPSKFEEEEDEIEEYHLDEEAYETIEMVDQSGIEVLESSRQIIKKDKIKTEAITKLVQISDCSKPKGRKRVVADQTRSIRKIRANTNQRYINSKGNEVKPKEFDENFECGCPKACTQQLSLKMRKQIFNMFWGIGSYEGRCAFLNGCVNEAPKKRQYTKNEDSRRKNTRKYFLKGVEVCKKTFVKTLMISNSRIDVSLKKMENETFTDERGKKRAGHGFSDEIRKEVINHIKESYDTSNSGLRGMWNDYQATHEKTPVSESYYKRMFYENFNLKITKKTKMERPLPIQPTSNEFVETDDDSD